MCGGGGGTTVNETHTGLGDDQYDALVENQGYIREDIAAGIDQGNLRADQIEDNLDEGFDMTEDRFDDVDDSLAGISGDMSEGFDDVLAGQEDLYGNVDERLSQSEANMTTGFADLTDTVNTGTETVIGNVDARAGEIQDTLGNRFDQVDTNLSQGVTDLTDTINANDAALLANQTEGFTAVGDQLTDAETNIGNQITDTQGNILDATTVIRDLVDKYGGDAAQYYAALSSGQEAIGERQGTLQTAFDSFRSDYDDNTTLANQQRSDLASSVIGGFNAMGETLGNQAEATSQAISNVQQGVDDVGADVVSSAEASEMNFGDIASGINNVGQGVDDVGESVAAGRQESETNFADTALAIATGQATTTAESAAVREQFTDKLDTVRDILSSENLNIDEGIKSNYQTLVDSFDAQGNLIESSVDANGNRVTRALTEQGDLFVASFDANGVRLDQQSLDINTLLNNVTAFEQNVEGQFTSIFGDAQAAEESRSTILSAFATTNSLIGDLGGAVSEELSANFNAVANAFDEQGNFLANAIDDNGNTVIRSIDENGNLFVQTIDDTNTVISESRLDIADISQQLNNVQNGLGDQLSSAFTSIASGSADANQNVIATLDSISSQLTTVGSGLQQEFQNNFTELQNAFDDNGALIRSEIDAAGNEIQRDLDAAGNLITTRIDSTGEVIDRSILNIADLSDQLNQIQGGLGDQITSAFDGIQQSSAELKTNLVGNLAGLRDIMLTQGETLGGDLQEKFSTLLDSFDENGDLIRSSIDRNGDFVIRQINENGELVINTVDDATGRLIEQDRFNAELLTQDFDSRFSSTEEFLQAVDRSITELGDEFQQGLLGAASGLEEGFMSRFDEMSEQQREGQNEFIDRLTRVKALLEEDVADLDDGLRNRMTALSQAFDGEGRLIADAIDANGNLLRRQIDDQGNLILTTFSRLNGAMLDQQALDINRLMNEIQDRSFAPGSNAMMGGRSPSAGAPVPASVYSGFASPYAQTF